MFCQAVIFTFDPLTLEVRSISSVTWSKSTRNLSEIKQSPAEWLMILGIFAHVVLRCDLDFELLQHFQCHAFKLCTKFEQNRIIHGWVIDDLISTFSPSNFREWGTTGRQFSGVRGRNFTKLGRDIGRSFLHKKFVLELRYFDAFSNAGGSKLSDVENDVKFRTFDLL